LVEVLTALREGLATPRGFLFPLNVVELIPLIETQPRVSQ
jgi:hypothetical protein